MKSARKAQPEDPSAPDQQGQPFPPFYNVKRIVLNIELELFDPLTNRLTGTQVLNPYMLLEADFPPGLMDYLASKGLKPANFQPKAKPKAKEEPGEL
jgi:hypothetical protein